MVVASTLRNMLWILQYPRLASGNVGPHDVGMMRARFPGTPACQIHYPCEISSCETAADSSELFHPYFRPEAVEGLSRYIQTDYNMLKFLSYKPPPCHVNAKPSETKFPVVIFSHGLGGCMEMYTQLCTHLSSQGYIVLAVEHEDGSGVYAETPEGKPIFYKDPDDTPYSRQKALNFRGPMLQQRVQEIEQVLDYLLQEQHDDDVTKNNGHLQKVLQAADTTEGFSLVGHSFGAATMTLVVQQLQERKKFKFLTLLDTWAFPLEDKVLDAGVSIPTLSILSHVWTTNSETEQVLQLLRASKNVTSFYVPHSVHTSFSDTPCWLPGFLATKMDMRAKEENRFETVAAVAEAHYHYWQNMDSSMDENSNNSMEDLLVSQDSNGILKPYSITSKISGTYHNTNIG